ncbi:MAG: ATP-binding cassette domain-containing protein [Tomitella sp.]|nr:ATP-binding cassette domain-containing protein [Tomitella sp.]
MTARFEARDGYAADSRVEAGLDVLGVGTVGRERRLNTLSGGKQARIALAASLAANAELLLLDEPTHHLSPALVEDLERAFASYTGAVILVTHDRRMRERFRGRRLALEAGRPVTP